MELAYLFAFMGAFATIGSIYMLVIMHRERREARTP